MRLLLSAGYVGIGVEATKTLGLTVPQIVLSRTNEFV
jgi:hypothetical protein